MAKYVCTVCGYVYEGDAAPEICPVCKAPAEKFKLQEGEKVWAAEHVVGVAKGVSEDIVSDLLLTVKVIRKLVPTMRKLHGKRQNTLQNSQNCSVKL